MGWIIDEDGKRTHVQSLTEPNKMTEQELADTWREFNDLEGHSVDYFIPAIRIKAHIDALEDELDRRWGIIERLQLESAFAHRTNRRE
jgi:phage tail sheath gpL-like